MQLCQESYFPFNWTVIIRFVLILLFYILFSGSLSANTINFVLYWLRTYTWDRPPPRFSLKYKVNLTIPTYVGIGN